MHVHLARLRASGTRLRTPTVFNSGDIPCSAFVPLTNRDQSTGRCHWHCWGALGRLLTLGLREQGRAASLHVRLHQGPGCTRLHTLGTCRPGVLGAGQRHHGMSGGPSPCMQAAQVRYPVSATEHSCGQSKELRDAPGVGAWPASHPAPQKWPCRPKRNATTVLGASRGTPGHTHRIPVCTRGAPLMDRLSASTSTM